MESINTMTGEEIQDAIEMLWQYHTEILVTDAQGRYIPQIFCQMLPSNQSAEEIGLSNDDINTCLDGPDNEQYWDAWDSILNNYQHTDSTGAVWSLTQDGDLRAIEYDAFHTFEQETGINPFEVA